MIKILLIWGTHQNESAVTQELAKLLKPLLEKRGFEVEIVEMPETLTLHYNAKMFGNTQDPVLKQNQFIWGEMVTKNAQFVFALHTTPDTYFNFKRSSKFIPARKQDFADFAHANEKDPLVSVAYYGEQLYYLEFPAKYVAARPDWANLYRKLSNVEKLKAINKPYFLSEAHLDETRKAGYLSPIVLAKTAHLLNTTVRTRLGEFRKPKTPPFRPKKPYLKKTRIGRRFESKKPF